MSRLLGIVVAGIVVNACASAPPVEPPTLESVQLPESWTAADVPVGQVAVDWVG